MTSARPSQSSLSDKTAQENRPIATDQHDSSSRNVLLDATAAADLNKQNVASNAGIDATAFHPDLRSEILAANPSFPHTQIQFRSNTIAPSPPLAQSPSLDGSRPKTDDDSAASRYQPSPLNTDLANDHRHSDFPGHPGPPHRTDSLNSNYGLSPSSGSTRPSAIALKHKNSASSLKPVSRTPSFKKGGYFGGHSAASSTVPSPIITAMGDVTPLPSPLLSTDSPGPWKRFRRPSQEHHGHRLSPPTTDSVLVTSTGESVAAALAHQIKRKVYAGLGPEGVQNGSDKTDEQLPTHGRNRSVSEYVPDPLGIPKRMITVSGSHVKPGPDGEGHMRREPHLSEARGLTPIEKPPTPPPSESSLASAQTESIETKKKGQHEYFEARGRSDNKKRRWRSIKLLGQGTFSRVMLATSQIAPSDDEDKSSGPLTPDPTSRYDRRTLVAVKVCESGPKGGASEDRVEMSLKRELEIMQSIRHPSLIDLKAWNIEPTRAILVLSYCPGGDLFDVASGHRELLTPSLLRRMFAELVGAVKYLHEMRIVHRDIKLENVLVNLTPAELSVTTTDWKTYPHSVITLTDLGLSRRVADDERLETRCGSDDYAAPEVIMGQAYDGRATDAWSLGVLLYALLEGRLPFDPHPGASDQHRMRSRTSHRIARVEWRWIEYAGDDGDHDSDEAKFEEKGLLGAMEITEGLLKRARSRWTLEKVCAHEWVKGAIEVPGGIKFREEKEAEEVS